VPLINFQEGFRDEWEYGHTRTDRTRKIDRIIFSIRGYFSFLRDLNVEAAMVHNGLPRDGTGLIRGQKYGTIG
jgi:hypothetical protein